MNTTELKQSGQQVFSTACRAMGGTHDSRGQARTAILDAIKQHGLTGMAASFAGDFAMAQFGYGGGL